jgi:hypothetical protein
LISPATNLHEASDPRMEIVAITRIFFMTLS